MMFFEIKISLFFSFSLRNDNAGERHQSVGDQGQISDHITLPVVSQQTVEPGSKTIAPVVASAPARPVLSRFARYFRAESAKCSGYEPESDDTHIADTHLAKASDRESLEILLRSSEQHEQPATAKASIPDTTAELSDSSFVHQSPAMSLDTLPEGPFVVRQSPVLEDDSGSDLVSSLQRIRIGGLASYFEELEKRARARTEATTTAAVGGGHDQRYIDELEADQYPGAYAMDDGEWSDMTAREASDEE
jgi:hypothetical protein